jgi:hypothetical protein
MSLPAQNTQQPVGIVRDNTIDARICQPLHIFGVIDGPETWTSMLRP